MRSQSTAVIGAVLATLAMFQGCTKSEPAFVPSVLQMPKPGDVTKNNLKIGDAFPVIPSTSLVDGTPLAFDNALLGEQYTLVVFWSTWCGFCMVELPHEIELSEQYAESGFRIIGINADETIEIGQQAAMANAIPWTNLYEGAEKVISDQLGIQSWPALFLLDSKGKIIATDKHLRRTTIRRLPNGETKATKFLDWTLEELFREKPSADAG